MSDIHFGNNTPQQRAAVTLSCWGSPEDENGNIHFLTYEQMMEVYEETVGRAVVNMLSSEKAGEEDFSRLMWAIKTLNLFRENMSRKVSP